ncbi:hypothetical protein NHX12_030480 [Muraenolepis orangiensis]|uniref:Uncharacterized protein n=1 Tax=Muraenolepis orangiensis TaxID=630683 RepID=A0A9Q0EBD2_9TELE|nr:hypothetical protein NHX12_030480 [Muraenolepis orangiensis]
MDTAWWTSTGEGPQRDGHRLVDVHRGGTSEGWTLPGGRPQGREGPWCDGQRLVDVHRGGRDLCVMDTAWWTSTGEGGTSV